MMIEIAPHIYAESFKYTLPSCVGENTEMQQTVQIIAVVSDVMIPRLTIHVTMKNENEYSLTYTTCPKNDRRLDYIDNIKDALSKARQSLCNIKQINESSQQRTFAIWPE